MTLPFGIQGKGFLVGILFAYFLLPMIQGWLMSLRGAREGAPA